RPAAASIKAIPTASPQSTCSSNNHAPAATAMTGEINAYRPGLLAPQSRTSRKYIVVEMSAPGTSKYSQARNDGQPQWNDIAAQAPGSTRSEVSSRMTPPIRSVRPASCTAPKCRIIGCVITDPDV